MTTLEREPKNKRDQFFLEMADALVPFAAMADVIDNDGEPGHEARATGLKFYEEANEVSKDTPSDTPVLSACGSWNRTPASYVTGITIGDFRKALAILHKAGMLAVILKCEPEKNQSTLSPLDNTQ